MPQNGQRQNWIQVGMSSLGPKHISKIISNLVLPNLLAQQALASFAGRPVQPFLGEEELNGGKHHFGRREQSNSEKTLKTENKMIFLWR